MSNSVNLSLDVTKTGIQNPLIKVRQGDGGFETLRTTVTANGEPMDLQGWTITFMGTTAGNHKIVDGNVTLVEAPNGIFDYTPSKAWGMDIGDFKIAYFKFVKGDGSASSANFRVSVIEAVDLTQEEAQNYISVVDTTIAEAREHLENSLADVTASVAATSSAASSLAVNVSSVASSAVYNINSAASNVSSVASSAVSEATSAASNVSSATEKVFDKLNNLSIGGRNYILNSSGMGASASNTPVLSGGTGDSKSKIDLQADSILMTNTNGSREFFYGFTKAWTDITQTPLIAGNNYTLSVKARGTSPQIALRLGYQNPDTSVIGFTQLDSIKWTKASHTFTIPAGVSNIFLRINGGINNRTSGFAGNETIEFKEVMLEQSNIASDWVPAPEDAPSNDAQLVHKTGNESISGDKTFTGSTTFAGIITGGQVTLPASGDLNKLTDTGKYYQSNGVNVLNWSNRPSNAPNSPFAVDVIGHVSRSLATQMYYSYTTSRMWIRTLWPGGAGIASSPWVELANDANVVHKTGNESVAGDKKFTGTVDAAQKVYTRTIGSTNDLQIIYTRVGNVVTGRYTAAKSGVFTLSNNDGYKSNSGYPVNVIAQNINAWFTTDNRFAAPDGASQGNFMFITNDPLPAN